MSRTMLQRACLTIALVALAAGCSDAPARRLRAPETGRHDLTRQLPEWIFADGSVDPGRAVCRPLLGRGWHPAETAADGMTYAWTAADTARLTVPSRAALPGRLLVRACGLADGRGPRRLGVLVNGRALETQTLPADLGTLSYAVPPGCMTGGGDTVALIVDRRVRPIDAGVSPDRRALGALVDFVRFVPEGAPAPDAAADPYDDAETFLGPGRELAGRPARLAGARLRLAWRADAAADSVVVEVASERGVPPLLRAAYPAGAAGATLEMPPTLPAKALLSLRLVGAGGGSPQGRATITALELERSVRPLDVVLIIIDTLRADHLGCYGDERGLTPAIDGLARDGILFEHAFSTAPITGPSHAALLTARWPSEAGVVNNFVTSPSPALPMLAELLRDLGYDTRAVVSISPIHRDYGFARGFDAFADELGFGSQAPGDTVVARARGLLAGTRRPLFLWAHFSEPHEPYDAHGIVQRFAELRLAGQPVVRVPTSTFTPTTVDLELPPHPTDLLFTSRAPFHVRWLDVSGLGGTSPTIDPADPPRGSFYTYRVGVSADGERHVRVNFALADQVQREEGLGARYAAEVAACDSSVGELLAELRRRGLYDESLIIFTADHGESLGEHGLVGHIENLTDTLIRVPLIVKPPREQGWKRGQRRRDLASLVDVLPTVLAQLGRPPLAGARGRDLLAAAAARGGDDAVFSETHRPQAKRTLYALRSGRYKIVFDAGASKWEFYDLRRDPGEEHDLYRPGHGEARRWQGRLEAVLAELKPGGALGGADETAPAPDKQVQRALRALGY